MDNTNVKASSDYAFNYTEHLVKKQADKKTVLARLGIILLTLALFGAVLFFTFGPIKVPQLAIIAIVLIIYVAILLWNMTNIEYEYIIASGEMSMDKIIAEKKRRRMVEFKVPSAEKIAPLSETVLGDARVITAVSSMNAEDAYCAVFNLDGVKTALIFNATDKALEMLRYYNKSCVIKK